MWVYVDFKNQCILTYLIMIMVFLLPKGCLCLISAYLRHVTNLYTHRVNHEKPHTETWRNSAQLEIYQLRDLAISYCSM